MTLQCMQRVAHEPLFRRTEVDLLEQLGRFTINIGLTTLTPYQTKRWTKLMYTAHIFGFKPVGETVCVYFWLGGKERKIQCGRRAFPRILGLAQSLEGSTAATNARQLARISRRL